MLTSELSISSSLACAFCLIPAHLARECGSVGFGRLPHLDGPVLLWPSTMVLTASEIEVHPAYKTIDWDLPPTQQGKCEVAKGRRGGPFNLYYEVHGSGPVKLVASLRLLFLIQSAITDGYRASPASSPRSSSIHLVMILLISLWPL